MLAQPSPPAEPWVLPPDAAVETPALVVDLDLVEANLDEILAVARNVGAELLPHAKTHRTPQLGRIQVDRGASGLCVAKLGEAEGFIQAGINRVLVAYPLVGADKAARAVQLARRADLTLAADSLEGARSLSAAFAAEGRVVDILLLIDTGLGRCGVAPEQAPRLARDLAGLAGVRVTGVLTHEGHVYGAGSPADLAAQTERAAAAMVEAAAGLEIPDPIVSMGASASVRSVPAGIGVNQLRPGIYAFNDLGQVALGVVPVARCSARVFTTVVSHPDRYRACIDAGSKTLSQDLLATPEHRRRFPGHGLLVGVEGWIIEKLSEEHGWLRWADPDREPTPLHVGQRLQIIPNHICTVFSSCGRSYPVRSGTVSEAWTTLPAGASQ